MKHFTLLSFFLLFFLSKVNGQDLFFSQVNQLGTFRNAANTGGYSPGYQLSFTHRKQWPGIGEGYSSSLISFESNEGDWGWGGLAMRNSAGQSSLKMTGVQLSGSYRKRLNGNVSFLAIGAKVGLTQFRFNPVQLTFDNQYNPVLGFDPSAASGELWNTTNVRVPDLCVGLVWHSAWNKESSIVSQVGLAIDHLNQPELNWSDNYPAPTYPIKFALHGMVTFPVSNGSRFVPSFNLLRQGEFTNLTMGVNAGIQIKHDFQFDLGVHSRFGDALVFETGFRSEKFSFGLSYDVNVSGLRKVTNGNGAIEVSAIVFFKKDKKRPLFPDRDGDGIEDKKDQCPELPGLEQFSGCPLPEGSDLDGDGIADISDHCPYFPGSAILNGCPDSDEDGVPDDEDWCPSLFGERSNRGCPQRVEDSDGDGVSDGA